MNTAIYKNYHDSIAQAYQAEALEAWDKFTESESHCDFIREFAEFRGDAITSDREAAAFMLALDAMNPD